MTPTTASLQDRSWGKQDFGELRSSRLDRGLRLVPPFDDADGGFEAVCRSNYEYVRNMIERCVRDPELAEELTQETFIRAYRSWSVFNRTSPPWPWLATISARLCSDAIRKRERERKLPVRPLETISDDDLVLARLGKDPESLYLAGESDVISALLPRHRRVLLRQYVGGYRYDELAKLEGMTRLGLHSLLIRARRGLRRAIVENGAGGSRRR